MRLLREVGVDPRPEWKDLVLRENYAPIPQLVAATPTMEWHRGFNMVILSRGVPKHFVKCRPAGDAVLERESTLRMCLAGSRAHGLSVPSARVASSARIAVQVGPYLRGVHYGRIVTTQSAAAYLKTLRVILDGAAELSALARERRASALSPRGRIELLAEARASLDDAAGLAALEPPLRAALEGAVRGAGEVPALPQHADFWWQNVLYADGLFWAIDFDQFGEVQVPLYDDLTMICTTLDLRPPTALLGFDQLLGDADEARACRALLAERAAAVGLTAAQVDGVLVYHLAHLASTVSRRGGATYAAPNVAAVRHVAELLASGRRDLLAPA